MVSFLTINTHMEHLTYNLILGFGSSRLLRTPKFVHMDALSCKHTPECPCRTTAGS